MSRSFDIIDPDRFTTGTVGPPGQRAFYVQAISNGELFSLKCEKVQIGAMAEYLNNLLTELPAADWKNLGDLELIEPVIPDWVIGTIGVAYDDQIDRVVIVVEELADEDNADPGTARIMVSRDQVRGFVQRARTLLASSRAQTNGHGG